MTQKYVVIMVLLFFSLHLFSQKRELGKVTKDELSEREYKKDTSASACILFKKAKTNFKYTEKEGFTSETDFEVKIKIYKKEGFKWANFEIPFYVGYKNLNDEMVEINSAFTYNLESANIVKKKVVNQSKFKVDINEFWAKKTVVFSNIKEGSIIEIKYKLKSENLSVLPEFKFQYEIPVNYAEYETLIPEFFIYKPYINGHINIETDQKVEQTSQSFQAQIALVKEWRTMRYNQIITSYKAELVPALINEVYVSNIDNYCGKLNHELQIIRYPNEESKQISTTWENVVNSIYKDEKFGKEIKEFDYFLNDLKVLVQKDSLNNVKIEKIFNYVKRKMKWNGEYGYYVKKGVKKAFEDSSGNVAEINLILLSMLRMAGIESYPVLISTRENGLAIFPNKSIFNYVIVAVVEGNEKKLLDATNQSTSINILPVRDLNFIGRLIKEEGQSEEINLMPKKNSTDVINIMASIKPDGEVTGKVRDQYFDYNAFLFRDNYGSLSKESLLEKKEKRYTGLEVSEYDVQNLNDLSKPIIENYSFINNNVVEIIGDKIYFSPFLHFSMTENPFKQEKREYPVDFVFPRQDKFNISITIPDGYVVETLPQSAVVTMPDGLGNFKYNISNNGNQVQLLYVIDNNQAIIGAEYYETLKNFYKEVINKQTEKIVLKKI